MRTHGRPCALIVDDEESVREVLTRALVRAGYESHVAESGLAALAEVRRRAFDAILVDVRMPGMDGPTLLKAIHEQDPDAPCLVISGYSDFEDAIRCLRHGATDFIKKPFDLDLVVRAVDGVAASSHLKIDSALLAATQSIFTSLDSVEVARRILRVTQTLMSADEVTLTLGGEAPREARRCAGESFGPGLAIPLAAWTRAIAVRDPFVLSAEVPADAGLLDAILPGADEVLVQRLAVGEKPVGLLCAGRGAARRRFGERDLRRATVIAGYGALALDNARLHAATAAHQARLEQTIERLIVAERIATLGRLSSGIGHEISNPAFAVVGHLELADTYVVAGRLEEAREAIAHAALAARGILDVCQALRPLASAGAQDDASIDVPRVVDGALVLTATEVRRRAKVSVDIAPGLPALSGSPAKLGQVLTNLLLNAAEAMAGAGIGDGMILLQVRVEGDYLVLRVEDDGPGVPAELAPRLFQPAATSRDPNAGHGMGLAISRWIVEEFHGRIRLLEREGPAAPGRPGAVFEVRLPLTPPPALVRR